MQNHVENENQMFKIYKKFNSVTFVKYLRVAIQIWKNCNNVGSRFDVQIKKSKNFQQTIPMSN